MDQEWTHSPENWVWTHHETEHVDFMSDDQSMDYPSFGSTSTPNTSPVNPSEIPNFEAWDRIQRISRFLDWVSLEAKRQSNRDHAHPPPKQQIERVVIAEKDPNLQIQAKSNQSKRRARKSDGNNNAEKRDKKNQNGSFKNKLNAQIHAPFHHNPNRRKQCEKVFVPLISIPPPPLPFRPKIVPPVDPTFLNGKKTLFQNWFPNLSKPPPNMR